MTRSIEDSVRNLCLAFPATEERLSHGMVDFRVSGKVFATFNVNHHGDGHVALWLHSPQGAQQLYSEMEPEHYFVPPYVGPRGWLGVELNRGLSWSTAIERVREAYEHIAPTSLASALPTNISCPAPERPMTAQEINPFLGTRAQEILARLGTLCDSLPETTASSTFGNPGWKAGKKTFVSSHFRDKRLCLQFWVGSEQQPLLCYDPHFSIPPYIGSKGWIELDVEENADWQEIEKLLNASYRHFALKRMLHALGGA